MPKPAPKDLRPLAPDGVHGWESKGPGAQYGQEAVFDVMDGGAEVYLDYHMERLLLLEYERPGRPGITLHLFQMGSSEEAYGVFSHEREGAQVDVGQEADYVDGLLRFWQGPYFVSLQATRETEPVFKALHALGRDIAGRIAENGQRPALLDRLPAGGQQPGTLRFVRTWLTLDHHVHLGMKNPLQLSRRTAVALARYGEVAPKEGKTAGGKTHPLLGLVVRYPKDGIALKAAPELNQRLNPPLGLAQACGTLLFAAIGGEDQEARGALLRRIHAPECGK